VSTCGYTISSRLVNPIHRLARHANPRVFPGRFPHTNESAHQGSLCDAPPFRAQKTALPNEVGLPLRLNWASQRRVGNVWCTPLQVWSKNRQQCERLDTWLSWQCEPRCMDDGLKSFGYPRRWSSQWLGLATGGKYLTHNQCFESGIRNGQTTCFTRLAGPAATPCQSYQGTEPSRSAC
jgi:hypothetical protein